MNTKVPDPGPAVERTALAWRRTAAGSCTCACLLVQHSVVGAGQRMLPLVATAAVAVTMPVVAAASLQRDRLLRERFRKAPAALLATAAAAPAAVAAGMAIVLLLH
ncbi:DUF202 domain-containing protein [Nocardia carnea]|uniref:DUF202 domain-containing protein n=1 Tax=Nocardia carnea TaxID=37328 RepID=UPI002456CD94|nr:DUF202 domain-containing protein [Nocardia carnea]